MTETLSVAEAATVAGVSVRTMRRWASSGHVRTVGSGHGRQVVADSLPESAAKEDTNGHEERPDQASDSATTVSTATETAKEDSGHEADRLADLVRELSEKLSAQSAMTALWQGQAVILSARLADAEDRLALAAPEPPTEAHTEPAPAAPSADASFVSTGRWWLRWALALIGAILLAGVLLGWPR